jgi:hypothetical protein
MPLTEERVREIAAEFAGGDPVRMYGDDGEPLELFEDEVGILAVDNLALRQQVKDAEQRLDDWIGGRIDIHELVVKNGQFNAKLGGEGPTILATALVELYRTGGGANYLEMLVGDPKNGERFAVTVQRVEGKTPHECRAEAEAKASALRAQNAALRAMVEEAVAGWEREPGLSYAYSADFEAHERSIADIRGRLAVLGEP